jgi:tetratricopeptide (TPR) repeat protein
MRIPSSKHLSDRWKTLFNAHIVSVHIGILLFLGVASYANSLNTPLQLDDISTVRISIKFNLFNIQEFIAQRRWFADLTFFLNRQLHGERVLGYHLLNLAIHLSSACVIYLVARQAIEALKRTFHITGDDERLPFLQLFIPLSTAALFVCHPVQTQAVTYISQRYTSLATLLYAGSLLAYLKARLLSADEAKKRHMWSWGAGAVVLAVLAMKSKEIALTLPLMAVMIEALLFRGRLLKNRLFLALCVGLILVIPLQLVFTYGAVSPENLLDKVQRAATETQIISRTDYLLTQFRVVATYLRLLILPINQNLDYDYPEYHSLFALPVLAALLLHITLVGLAMFLFFRSKRQLASGAPLTGICLRIASLGIFWFYLALSVESSLIPINDVIFEHRLYLPSVGFFMAATAGCAGIAAQRQRYRTALWAATALLCLALAAGTLARNRVWSSELALWQDVLEKSPNKARARFAIGELYCRNLMPEKALPYLVRTLEIDPRREKHWMILNTAIMQLGRYKGRASAGMEYYVASAVKVDPNHKSQWLALSYNNLGLAYEHLGNRYLARESYHKAVTVNPSLDLAWYNLSLLAANQKDTASVESSLEKLRTINPVLAQDATKTIREQMHSVQPKAQ